MKPLAPTLLLSGILATASWARDCAVSKEFSLDRSQVLAGVLEDPAGARLPGVELKLLTGKELVKQVRTSQDGEYSFGDIAQGGIEFTSTVKGSVLPK